MTTPLRLKMIEDMQLHGLAVRTQESYLLAVRQLARHYQKSPDQINEEELREYFLYLKNDKHASHILRVKSAPMAESQIGICTETEGKYGRKVWKEGT